MVGFSPDYCAERAVLKAAQHGSYPILIEFPSQHPGVRRLEPAGEEHHYLTGHFNIADLAFPNRFGQRGTKALQELAASVPGAMVRTSDTSNRIYVPSEDEVLRYVFTQLDEGHPVDAAYLNALAVAHRWATEAVHELKMAAGAGHRQGVEDIVVQVKGNTVIKDMPL